MPEQLPQNSLPLNQQAKQALKMLKVSPDPDDLYLLELMRWCVAHKKVNLPEPHTAQSTLREFLDAFHTWDPKNIMQVFQEDSDGYPI
jgi:hypothetical protein